MLEKEISKKINTAIKSTIKIANKKFYHHTHYSFFNHQRRNFNQLLPIWKTFPHPEELKAVLRNDKFSSTTESDTPLLISIIQNQCFKKSTLTKWRENLQQVDAPECVEHLGILSLACDINHLFILVDGSRRWAKNNNLPVAEGHKKTYTEKVPSIIEDVFKFGVHTFTFNLFMQRNLQRDREELCKLLTIYENSLDSIYLPLAKKYSIRLNLIGSSIIPKNIDTEVFYSAQIFMEKLQRCIQETQKYTDHQLNFIANYEPENELKRIQEKLQTNHW